MTRSVIFFEPPLLHPNAKACVNLSCMEGSRMDLSYEMEQQVIADWGEDSLAVNLYRQFLRFRSQSLNYILLPMVVHMSRGSLSTEKAENIMLYFCEEPLSIFERRLELIDGDDESHEIPVSLERDFLNGEKVYDPETGEEIKDFASDVYSFFTGTDRFRDVVGE